MIYDHTTYGPVEYVGEMYNQNSTGRGVIVRTKGLGLVAVNANDLTPEPPVGERYGA